jgi:hypothetical protein
MCCIEVVQEAKRLAAEEAYMREERTRMKQQKESAKILEHGRRHSGCDIRE